MQRVVDSQLPISTFYANFRFFDSGIVDITVIKWNNFGELFLINIYVVDPSGEGDICDFELAEVCADVAEAPLLSSS